MKPQFPSLLRSGLIAIGLAAATCVPAAAVPSGYLEPSLLAEAGSSSPEIIQIRDHSRRWIRKRKHWSGSGDWSDRKWSHHGDWSGKRRWSGRHRSYRHRDDWWPGFGTGLIFSLGLPLYRYRDPYWYGDPYLYAPRRVYRTYALPAAHVRWCHMRWRSYREWDNSYQPYHGPRRQCRSPYG